MKSVPTTQKSSVTLAQEGEAIGTLEQFSEQLDIAKSRVVDCLSANAEDAVILTAGDHSSQLLVVDDWGLDALRSCAKSRSA